MLRNMYVIKYVDRFSWHLSQKVQINASSQKYKKGDVIQLNNQKYIVIEDFYRLRVKRFQRGINPLLSLTAQIPNR
ncbi:hypothetical protein M3N64_01045 [Sporolactobacillus sp. CPB3-1]|uniref:RNA-binding S4 domain-containing protein n=1 Tax=Sporolactobacillus mangiferae TaxID=2940498 RepID=A0ABT0M6P4_9BACL|nr:hypothetical protein [Sporolactobacillus mangiferae]MCL1630539.1 hypothetical protein [Sporolactobacillus mangiferae]